MVTDKQRKFIVWMVKLGLWKTVVQMRLTDIRACRGTQWILDWLLKRQKVDDYHHAPCCEANHYHNTRLVFQHCNCGAEHYAKVEAIKSKTQEGRRPSAYFA